jgi:hypothetical protein
MTAEPAQAVDYLSREWTGLKIFKGESGIGGARPVRKSAPVLWRMVENQMPLAFEADAMIRTKSEHNLPGDQAVSAQVLWISSTGCAYRSRSVPGALGLAALSD